MQCPLERFYSRAQEPLFFKQLLHVNFLWHQQLCGWYLWESKNLLFFPLTMQLCMQRYGHKTYDVIRVQCRITTRLCKKMTNKKKVKIIKSFLLHHYTYLVDELKRRVEKRKIKNFLCFPPFIAINNSKRE